MPFPSSEHPASREELGLLGTCRLSSSRQHPPRSPRLRHWLVLSAHLESLFPGFAAWWVAPPVLRLRVHAYRRPRSSWLAHSSLAVPERRNVSRSPAEAHLY